MQLQDAIRTWRTHKAYRAEPVDRATLEDLLELARWAPNHHLTNPWRFRVLGPQARSRLEVVADALEPGSGRKLHRAPTFVVVTAHQAGEAIRDRKNILATALAAYVVLLAAHDPELAGYWRTPAVLRDPRACDALGIGRDEEFVGLLYLGYPRQEQPAPARLPVTDVVEYLE